MDQTVKNILTVLAPVLGAGAVGACPLCWISSASLLTYLGLGALVPAWRWVILVLLGLSFVGFAFDYRSHKNLYPLLLLASGGLLLYIGRYVFVAPGFGNWYVWGPGAILVLAAVIYNKQQFSKKSHHHQQ